VLPRSALSGNRDQISTGKNALQSFRGAHNIRHSLVNDFEEFDLIFTDILSGTESRYCRTELDASLINVFVEETARKIKTT